MRHTKHTNEETSAGHPSHHRETGTRHGGGPKCLQTVTTPPLPGTRPDLSPSPGCPSPVGPLSGSSDATAVVQVGEESSRIGPR